MVHDSQNNQFLPEIRLGKPGILKIHQISEDELKILSQGSPSSLYLNFAIALLSIAISFLISLLTTDLTSKRVVFDILFITMLVCGIGGLVLLFRWWFSRKSVSSLVKDIRNRMSPEGESKSI